MKHFIAEQTSFVDNFHIVIAKLSVSINTLTVLKCFDDFQLNV